MAVPAPLDGRRPYLLARAIPLLYLAGAALFRLFCVARYRIDSDEPQHLHVAWEWTRGLIAYRDYFDNHMPLFHLIAAPFLAAVGETSDILLYGRLLMLPIAALTIGIVHRLASRLYDPTTALWCTVAVSLIPPTLLKGVEFRNDNLCVALVLASLLFLVRDGEGRHDSPRRHFLAGLLLGTAFMVSIKTAIFVAAAGMSWLLALAATRDALLRRPRALTRLAGATLAGFAIVPALTAMAFALLGALPQLVFGVYGFNRLFPTNPVRTFAGAILFLPFVAATTFVARRFGRGADRDRAFLALLPALFTITILGFWPLITTRDFLPIFPLLAILATAYLTPRVSSVLIQGLAIALVGACVLHGDLSRRPDDGSAQLIDETLLLTKPGDTVLDLKGETVFRHRATYFILERVGRELLRSGVLTDTMAQDAVAARCYVAGPDDNFFPLAARRFLREHYLPVGRLRVAGQEVRGDGTFTIAVPGEYTAVMSGRAAAAVEIDGRPFAPGTPLGAGLHRVTRRPAGDAKLAVVWAQAVERGFVPAL